MARMVGEKIWPCINRKCRWDDKWGRMCVNYLIFVDAFAYVSEAGKEDKREENRG